MKIAHVGAHKPFTDSDGEQLMYVLKRIIEDKLIAAWRDCETDIVNLDYGRDFLIEKTKYDVVVLHDIFHTSCIEPRSMMNYQASIRGMRMRVSAQHSIANWRKRLSRSGATLIFVFEGRVACLNGWQLDDLKGFKIFHRDTKVTIYTREKRRCRK